MADKVKAGKPAYAEGDGEVKFPPHPEGAAMMVCVDVVDLGEAVVKYQNNPPYLVQKAALVFCSGQKDKNGNLWEVAPTFTVSTGRKSKLRPFLEAWFGKKMEGDYPDVELDKCVGKAAYCTIGHDKSESTGYTYANIVSIAPLPPNTPKPEIHGYTRLDRWEKKRTANNEEAQIFRRAQLAEKGMRNTPNFRDAPAPEAESDLPF